MSKSNGLDYEELLRRSDLRQEVIHVPRWDKDVTISELSAAALMDVRRKAKGDEEQTALLTLQAALVQPHLTVEQIRELWGKASDPLTFILKAIANLNGTSTEAATEIEESFPAEVAGRAD
jgi:hypothetical protein